MKKLRRFLWFGGFLARAVSLPAQTFNVLHTFGPNSYTNTDGAGPSVTPVLSAATLYGAAGGGANGSGTNNFGTIFSLGVDGSDFTVLHTFTGVTNSGTFPAVGLNAEGYLPQGNLILAGQMLYGAAGAGGTNGSGTLFAVSTDGSVFTLLHTFEANIPPGPFPAINTNSEGFNPNSLVRDGDTLYGTANDGGTNGFGTIFSIKTNGAGFTVLHTFKNAEGKNPQSVLLVTNGTIYGTTPVGGSNGVGTVYSVSTNGANFRVLHSFTGGSTAQGTFLNGLLLDGGTLYGTISIGGTNNTGYVFALNTNGGSFTTLHTFGTNELSNPDGVGPEGSLLLVGNTLYGTANLGGAFGNGVVYSVNTNGSDFNTLYAFSKLQSATNLDGAHPRTGLVLGGASLYGTAYFGGGNANGTIFDLVVQPTLTGLSLAGNNAVINGINGLAGHTYTTLSSTNTALPLSQWVPVATNSIAGGGPFSIVATNAVEGSATEQFYILQAQ